jgi:hypothetical protein
MRTRTPTPFTYPTPAEIRASVAEANARLDTVARNIRDRDFPMLRGFK